MDRFLSWVLVVLLPLGICGVFFIDNIESLRIIAALWASSLFCLLLSRMINA